MLCVVSCGLSMFAPLFFLSFFLTMNEVDIEGKKKLMREAFIKSRKSRDN